MTLRLPLAGTTVLDFTTNISGPYTTFILANMGAEIWKVERPDGGDDTRKMSPVVDGKSAYFTAINTLKKSIVLDLKSRRGPEVAKRLASEADILVENFRPGVLDRLGLSYQDLRKRNPKLVYASISGYGQSGLDSHRAGYDALLQARTGLMSVTGRQGQAPVRVGVSILDMSSGLWAALEIVAALYAATTEGRGQLVTTSLFETGLAYLAYHLAYKQMTGETPLPQGADHLAFSPYSAYSTSGRDEFIFIGISNDRQFESLAKVLGHPEWAAIPEYRTNADRVKNKDSLRAEMEGVLRQQPSTYWEELLTKSELPASRLQGVEEVLNDPQADALGVFRDAEGPGNAKIKVPRLPLNFGGGAPRSRATQRPPRLGENTAEILRSAGFSKAEIQSLLKDRVVT